MGSLNISASAMANGTNEFNLECQTIKVLLDALSAKGIARKFRVGRVDGVWSQVVSFDAGSADEWQLSAQHNKLGYWTFIATHNGQPSTTHKLFRGVGVWL